MSAELRRLIEAYQPGLKLDRASTIPSSWYTDARIAELERSAVFSGTWQFAARADQLKNAGDYVTTDVAGEPVVVVRGEDHQLRAFYNVCRHHAAAVMTQPQGRCHVMQCPYHAWTYALDGSLKGMPDWDGVQDFRKRDNGLVPIRVETWENFVFVKLGAGGAPADALAKGSESLAAFLGDMPTRVESLNLTSLRFFERRSYDLKCNWKVYVDNYLDGGYHVPHLHKSLNTVLDYGEYTIETCGNYCLQSSPLTAGSDADTASVRRGNRAYYYWVYPNFMLNWYEGVMDTNLVMPLAVNRCRVIFDFYFDNVEPAALDRNQRSVMVGERVQQEDIDVCESVQRGLTSRAYDTGRLSVRREAGEQQFHRRLHDYMNRSLSASADSGSRTGSDIATGRSV
ncbi:MAG: Rieske 2Fe-2S domain-containing protein [Phycisphaerae bacterium]|nr:Rieske 2Fe-2S domain-containing protein [Phycisphaerae bacterium]